MVVRTGHPRSAHAGPRGLRASGRPQLHWREWDSVGPCRSHTQWKAVNAQSGQVGGAGARLQVEEALRARIVFVAITFGPGGKRQRGAAHRVPTQACARARVRLLLARAEGPLGRHRLSQAWGPMQQQQPLAAPLTEEEVRLAALHQRALGGTLSWADYHTLASQFTPAARARVLALFPRVQMAPGPPPAAAAPVVLPTGHCARCGLAMLFTPPQDAMTPHKVRCPSCGFTTEFVRCWTCPATLAGNIPCAACRVRDTTSEPTLQVRPPPPTLQPSPPPLRHASLPAPEALLPVGTKGLRNAAENNCFLNATLQTLWHLEAFRRRFQQWSVQHAPHCTCMHCALTQLFTQYAYADASVLSPELIRRNLAAQYTAQDRFRMGDLSDATECFDAVCSCLHNVAVADAARNVASLDAQCHPTCAVHEAFCLLLQERTHCRRCGTHTDDTQSMFLHYCYQREVVKAMAGPLAKSFGKVLYKLNKDKQRSCGVSGCPGQLEIHKTLLRPYPEVIM